MQRLDVERLGGFAGFGNPGSRLRSRGTLENAGLSATDRQCVDALFAHPPSPAGAAIDGFRYRLTRHTEAGSETIEIPEQHVPAAVRQCVRDELV